MNLMNCRLIGLKKALAGLTKTGMPLIDYDGSTLMPSFTADDIGIYVVIPQLAQMFGIGLDRAIDLFFFGMLLVPAAIGMLGFFYYYESTLPKAIATLGLLLVIRRAYGLGDTYLAYYAPVVALAPWALYFAKKNCYSRSYCFFMAASGLIISFLHFVRSYSGLGVLVFVLILFFMRCSCTHTQRFKLLLTLFVGMSLPVWYFNHVFANSVSYAQQHLPQSAVGQKRHVFWHNLYIGFGFLKMGNTEGITYDDSFGFNKALEKKPGLTIEQTNEYESIIKNEVINLVKNHWNFVVYTLFAKLGILLLFLLQYANVGLLAAIAYRKPWWQDLAFFIATSFYALFPLLAIPTFLEYALGFIACATLYGVVSINYALIGWNKK